MEVSNNKRFLSTHITKANFGIEPEFNLNNEQFARVKRFLSFQRLPGEQNQAIDVIIIPTTSPNFDEESFDKRIASAVHYSNIYKQAVVIFCGKRPDVSRATEGELNDDYSEAQVMADTAQKRGLEANTMLEEDSLHTGQNIRNVVSILKRLGKKRVLVVSSSYMGRRIDYYLSREMRQQDVALETFIFDADVYEDVKGGKFQDEETNRKNKCLLYEAKRLSEYRYKNDL